VNDEDVTGRPTEHVLIDAPLHEALEEPLLAGSDDDQVDVSLLRQAHDGISGGAHGRDEFRIEMHEYRDLGRTVLALGQTWGRGRDGIKVDSPGGWVCDMRQGKIQRFRSFN